jgi:hypothetical protein
MESLNIERTNISGLYEAVKNLSSQLRSHGYDAHESTPHWSDDCASQLAWFMSWGNQILSGKLEDRMVCSARQNRSSDYCTFQDSIHMSTEMLKCGLVLVCVSVTEHSYNDGFDHSSYEQLFILTRNS